MYNCIVGSVRKPRNTSFDLPPSHLEIFLMTLLVEKITIAWESGDIVFLDLKKEFDTVLHDILLKKIYAYGNRGPALKLLKSYLTGRTQYVIYDGIQSTTLPISCGAPHSSILEPLVFIITMNDIGNVSEFLYTILYADDTCVLLNGNEYMNLVTFLIVS